MKDYYNILNVSKTASLSEIKTSFRKLALEHHPDKGGNSDTFKDISEAYEILSDEQKRNEYDNGGISNNFQQFNPFEHFQQFNAQFGNQFASHFGNQFGTQFGFNQNSQQQSKIIEVGITISLYECFTGVNKTINFTVEDNCNNCSKQCNTCNGSGKVEKIEQMNHPNIPINFCRKFIINCTTCNGIGLTFTSDCSVCNNSRKTKEEEKIDLFIFPGIQENQIMNVKYSKNSKNTKSYELSIKTSIDYNNYIRNNFDLIYKINIPFINSISGHSQELLLPDNNKILLNSLDFNEIIQNNKHYVTKYKGLPIFNNETKKINDYGKLYIEYNIQYPKIKINIEKKDTFIQEFNKFILAETNI
jgi:molecular chaperone DnaJ